jgi:hypothetical protein
MLGHPYQACTQSINRHAGFVQICEFKSISKAVHSGVAERHHPPQADLERPLCEKSVELAGGPLVAELGLIFDGPSSTLSGYTAFPEADIEAKPCSHAPERSGVNTNPTIADNGQGQPGTLTRANNFEMP